MSNPGGASHGPHDLTTRNLQSIPLPQPGLDAVPTQATPQGFLPQQIQSGPTDYAGTGRLVAGRYRLLSKLGHGGMGTVWHAKDETVDREVAVKEPRVPDHLPERERANVFERMRREARAAARLDHPAVVNVHDVAIEDGQPWIVMEFVQGRSLGDALREGTLGARDTARIGLEVLGALEAAHTAGILHRDVKPDNVMLGRYGRVVLTDFGIAQIEGETNLTDTGNFVGSPEFIAPERVLGQRPGPASDLWSLGVVLYVAAEGVSPFRRNNTPATLQAVLNGAPAAPAAAQGPLATLINGLLHKDPAHRPTAAQARALLEQAAAPPAPAPQRVVQFGSSQGGVRLGTKTLLGLGASLVALLLVAWLVVAQPWAGPLPDDWKRHTEQALGVTVAVPAEYRAGHPDSSDSNKDWATYTDLSGVITVGVELFRKSDSSSSVKDSAAAQMYTDNETFTKSGYSKLDMPKGAKTDPKSNVSHHGRPAAENTVKYDTDDSKAPLPREIRFFYYRTEAGDLYRLSIGYPGRGDFTGRGREVASAVIENFSITAR